ncbi:MAG: DUF4956 domain-containing protein [Lachnospiraceae bacterium]|nr:DUF4956 domain-containing protein [Lachnospiraceae bacterium]
MNHLQTVFQTIADSYSKQEVGTAVIVSVLFCVLLLSVYEFVIYRVVSHRAFYNRSFHISIAVIPFFISTIILCLQSNIVITLGTIGALAIVRFRTAVKDPVDMIYILWSIHTGIICGCQLYEVAVLTSLLVTIVLLVMENLQFGKKPYVLVVQSRKNVENEIVAVIGKHTKAYKVQSRIYQGAEDIHLVIELSVKDPAGFTTELGQIEGVERFSLLTYDAEDLV